MIGRRRHPVFFRRPMTSAPFEPERTGKIVDAILATSTKSPNSLRCYYAVGTAAIGGYGLRDLGEICHPPTVWLV